MYNISSGKGDPWQGRIDLLQSMTGLFLWVFLCLHIFLTSSILLGQEAMWRVSRFFEGYYFFGETYPSLVFCFAATVFALFIAHAGLTLGRFPANVGQWRAFWSHARVFRHRDTTLWIIQVITGFAMLFLGSVHLYVILTHPEQLGPIESSVRVWTERFFPLDLLLLLVVVPHGCIGFYRFVMKWSHGLADFRIRLRWAMLGVGIVFLLLGFLALTTYIRIGIEHAAHAGLY